jgi:hypothetical protein
VKKQAHIDQVWTSGTIARPGETIELTAVVVGENGTEIIRKASYPVPPGAPPGTLYFTVADGSTANLTEFRHLVGTHPKSPAQVISLLNTLRPNNKAYVRVWRPEAAYQVQGEDMPNTPASVAMILSRSQNALGGPTVGRTSKLAEFEFDLGDAVVTGSRTVQVEIKE